MKEVAYVLLVDGIDRVFATTEDVTNSDAQAWGFETAFAGLGFPQRLPCSLDVRTGQLATSSATFDLSDIDGSLPALFGASLDSSDPLLTPISPADDPAPSATWGMHVGTEFIGPAGERRRYSCVPTWNVGLAHLPEAQADTSNLGAAPVSEAPVVWAGRRVCLHRLERTSFLGIAGPWSDLTNEADRNATRLWFGTLTGSGEQDQRSWSLAASGPESWIMGTLGAGFSDLPISIEVSATLNEEAGEHVLYGGLVRRNLFDAADIRHDYVPSHTDDVSLAGASTYDEIVAGMQLFLDALANDASEGTAFSAENNSASRLRCSGNPGDDGISVKWDRPDGYAQAGIDVVFVRIVAHEKVWLKLGYDPKVQNSTIDPIEHPDKYGQFEPHPTDSGWWRGYFYSADAAAMAEKEAGNYFAAPSNLNYGGDYRRWPPIYVGGTNSFDLGQVGQAFRLSTVDPVYLPSSASAPLPADPDDNTSVLVIDDVGACTHQGLVAFTGPYRDETNPEAEVTEITLVARVAWRQTPGGEVSTDSGAQPKLVVYDWPDPKLYGIDSVRPALWAAWRIPPEDGVSHTMRPLLAVEHNLGPDNVGYALARLFASTGAHGAWYADPGLTIPAFGLAGERYLDVGPNDLGLTGFGDQSLGRYTDAESSTYGLGVPAEMIAGPASQPTSFESAIERMSEPIYRCKVVLGKVSSTREVTSSMLAPTGWCLSLAGGRFGLFDPFEFKPLLGTGSITNESLAGKPGDPTSVIPTQQLRKWAPIDRIETQARLDPITGKFARTETLRSSDPSASYRAQSLAHKIDGSHLINPRLGPGEDWIQSFQERWRKATRWWSKQHFEAEFTVPARRAHEFWPGSDVEVSNPWLVNPATASYGVSAAPGYVLSRDVNAQAETCEITCLVSGGTLLLYAPAALALGSETYDDVNHRIYVADDYLGLRGNTGTLDVDGFVEPPWSTAGGNASIEVFSFNGVTWVGGIYGTVLSVNRTPGSCYLQLTEALTGGPWYRDQYHLVVLREATNQAAAWPLIVYAPIGNKAGNWTGSTKTHQFRD